VDGKSLVTIVDELPLFERFITVDPAGTPEEEARRKKGRDPSWSVIQVWDQPKAHRQFLLLRDQCRERVEFTELCEWIGEVAKAWQVKRIYVELESTGRAIISHFKNTLPILALPTGGEHKKNRSLPLQEKMSAGQVFLPRDNNSWLGDFEAELLAWTGHERQPADQIDAAAYAAIIAQQDHGGTIRMQSPVTRG
jgi:phage terminase large subunit-like protein